MKQRKQTNKKQGPSTVIQAVCNLVASVDQWLLYISGLVTVSLRGSDT